jgi:2-dehydro-3-deoxy-D-gluconate 5-dehydrogenase
MALPTTDARPLSDLFRFAGRAVLVTGGAKGIGRGIALRFAEAGAQVMISDLDEAAGTEAARACEQKGAPRARFFRADVSKVAEARAAVGATVDAFGRIDVAVNNAGIFPIAPALEIDEAGWDQVLDVNLKGAFFVCQEAARAMLRKEAGDASGAIINIASIDAFHPSGNLVHYDASKGAMVMMTKSLAKELTPLGVRVNCVAPGAITTPGAQTAMKTFATALGVTAEQMTAGYAQKIPSGRMGIPDDIATATLFLASDASIYVTGQTLIVDGGLLLS